MHFALTEDQRLIQESVHAALADVGGTEALRKAIAAPDGWDPALWSVLARDMGFAGLMIPEDLGGAGLSAVEMALVLEETGACLAVAPFFETAVLATQAILTAGTEAQKQSLLPGLATGETKATLAFAGRNGALPPAGLGATLRRAGDGWVLSGEAGFVTFAHIADLILVAARAEGTAHDISIVALSAATAGLVIERQHALDPTRPFSRLTFLDVVVPADAILGAPGGGGPALNRTLTVAAGLLAAEQTGGAAFCLSSTVDYAGQRQQFGRAIGSFQAVKHELADMMLQVEAARSAALYAAAALDHGGPEAVEAASVARSWCSDAYRHCAAEAIQLHGGIGFTWEHHAHLYFKRAWATSTWLGDAASHRERIACLIGLDA